MNKITKRLVDSNVILRFILNDNQDQWRTAHEWFATAKPNSIWLTDAVFLEVAFVLQSVYRASRLEVIDFLSSMLEFRCFDYQKSILTQTVDIFVNSHLSLLECYLVALFQIEQCQGVLTFDKKLLQVIQKKL